MSCRCLSSSRSTVTAFACTEGSRQACGMPERKRRTAAKSSSADRIEPGTLCTTASSRSSGPNAPGTETVGFRKVFKCNGAFSETIAGFAVLQRIADAAGTVAPRVVGTYLAFLQASRRNDVTMPGHKPARALTVPWRPVVARQETWTRSKRLVDGKARPESDPSGTCPRQHCPEVAECR